MTHSENHDFFLVMAVERYIRAIAEFDDPFTKFGWQVFDWPAHTWMFAQSFHALANGFDGATGSLWIFAGEKGVETGYIEQGRLGPP